MNNRPGSTAGAARCSRRGRGRGGGGGAGAGSRSGATDATRGDGGAILTEATESLGDGAAAAGRGREASDSAGGEPRRSSAAPVAPTGAVTDCPPGEPE